MEGREEIAKTVGSSGGPDDVLVHHNPGAHVGDVRETFRRVR